MLDAIFLRAMRFNKIFIYSDQCQKAHFSSKMTCLAKFFHYRFNLMKLLTVLFTALFFY